MKTIQLVVLLALVSGAKAHACAAQDALKRTQTRQAAMDKANLVSPTKATPAPVRPSGNSDATRETRGG